MNEIKTGIASSSAIENLDPRTHIIIKGARVHNLKNVDVAIPRNQFVVITGLSGSGNIAQDYRFCGIMSNINGIFGSILENSSNSNVTAYPQNLLHRSGNYITLFDTTLLPYNKPYNNCKRLYTNHKQLYRNYTRLYKDYRDTIQTI